MRDFLIFFAPLVFGLVGIACFVGVAWLYFTRRELHTQTPNNGPVYMPEKLYLTCGYCGQSVPSNDGFTVDPHKYTFEAEEGKLRIDCPQGRA